MPGRCLLCVLVGAWLLASNASALSITTARRRSEPGGAGFARAHASGASGEAAAVASTATLFGGEQSDDEQVGRIQVGLAASVAVDTTVAASSQRLDFAPGSDDAAFDGFVRSAYRADAALVAAAVAGNPLAAAAPMPPRSARSRYGAGTTRTRATSTRSRSRAHSTRSASSTTDGSSSPASRRCVTSSSCSRRRAPRARSSSTS